MNWTHDWLKEAEQRIQAQFPAKTERIALPRELPKPKRKGRPPAAPPEREVLRVALKLLKRHPNVAWARRLNNGRLCGVRFGFIGCSDIVGQMKDGRFLAVETKRANGRAPTVAQGTFLAMVKRHNGVAGVVRSVDELLVLIGE